MQDYNHTKTIHIVCSTDTNYIMPTGVMIKSIWIGKE